MPLQDPYIGTFEIGEVGPTADGANQKVKVKVRINLNGTFGVNSATFVEKHEIEEEVPMEVEEPQKDDTAKNENKEDSTAETAKNDEKAKPAQGEKNEDAEMKDDE